MTTFISELEQPSNQDWIDIVDTRVALPYCCHYLESLWIACADLREQIYDSRKLTVLLDRYHQARQLHNLQPLEPLNKLVAFAEDYLCVQEYQLYAYYGF